METEEESTSWEVSRPSRQTLDLLIISSLGLGLGLGLRFHRVFQAQTLKPLSTAIKVADGALKGTKVLQEIHSPSPSALVFASKVLIKGYKALKRLNLIRIKSPVNSSVITRRLKSYVAVINLVRYAQSSLSGNGFLGLGFLSNGYKFSKNFLKVLEGFVGFQLDSAIRNGFDVLGLLVRAAVVARELRRITIGGCERSGCCCRFVRTVDTRYGVRLVFKGIDIAYNSLWHARRFPLEHFPPTESVLIFDDHLSELLCLSIPIWEEISHPVL